MRLLPRSLAGRLTITAAAAIVVALAVASLLIGHVLGRFVTQGFDRQLDAQLAVLARAVGPNGVAPGRIVDVPPFDAAGSDWLWQVDAGARRWRSASLGGRTLRVQRMPAPPDRPPPGPRPFEGRAPDGEPVHGRLLTLPTTAGPVTLIAAGPRHVIARPLREAAMPLLASVALLGVALGGALLVQLRLGLRPLGRLRAMVAEVRDGRRRRIEADEPAELLPLVAELNALLDANETGLAAARLHVANLAHGLKTPLAALRLDLDAARDPDGRLAAQVGRMEAQIRHHLARGRAAGSGGTGTVALAPAIAGIVAALARIHADRAIACETRVEDIAVLCDAQDLDEALGNLLDNAWTHARRRVLIASVREGRLVRLIVADDGGAISNGRLAALNNGTIRADERGDGHGQGVRIARELIELHGGALAFERGADGGLTAVVRLPAAG